VHRPSEAWPASEAGSLQEAARELRYAVMLDLARHIGAPAVAVAHHMDDQAETILLRMIRGAGARGLAAMRPRRPLCPEGDVELIRPLLFASREEIERYADARQLQYRYDRSNGDARFDRVRVRHLIMPAIRDAFGDSAVRNMAETALRLGEMVDYGIRPIVDEDLKRMTTARESRILIDLEMLSALPEGRRRLVLLRALERYLPDAPQRATIVNRAESLISARPGKQVKFRAGALWRGRESLVLVPTPIVPAAASAPIVQHGRTDTTFGRLTVESLPLSDVDLCDDRNTEVMDGGVLANPLSLGPWRPGERFQPLGLDGTKKISDLLTDAKIPTYLRQTVPVVRSGKEVAWIPGLRLAHKFRLTHTSTAAVRMTFEPAIPPAAQSSETSM
jgi:tRNA(Ile)-lysidine synthase